MTEFIAQIKEIKYKTTCDENIEGRMVLTFIPDKKTQKELIEIFEPQVNVNIGMEKIPK